MKIYSIPKCLGSVALTGAVLAGLSGCSGGTDLVPPGVAATGAPITPVASPTGFGLISGLVAAGGDDTGEPLTLGDDTDVASSETDEPDSSV